MTREQILETYHSEMLRVLASETPSLLYIRGLTDFCEKMLADNLVEEEQPTEEPVEVEIVTKFGKGSVMSAADIQRMQNLKDSGISQAEIARIMGCSPASVCRHLKGYSAKKTTEPGKGHIDWFRDLAVEGMGIKAISDRTGYAESVVRQFVGGDKD